MRLNAGICFPKNISLTWKCVCVLYRAVVFKKCVPWLLHRFFFTARILLNFHRKCDNFVAEKPRLTYFFLKLNTTLSNSSQCKGAQSFIIDFENWLPAASHFLAICQKKNGNSLSRPQIRVILSPDSICSFLAAVVSCHHYATFQINKYLQVVPKPSVCK